ncbi:MAG: MATE family efflux transporter [Bacilli bacterium]|nr:MATE family efflux transporter [Bacilli bacterium]
MKLKPFFSKDIDMQNGNLFVKLIIFALPIMLTTVFQLLYSTIDLISVQKWGGGDNSMGAIAANGSLINLIIIVFANLSLGSNVAIANAKGAGNKERASNVLHTSILVALFSGIFVGIVGYFFSDNLLRLMGTEPLYLDLASTYLKIYFLGLPFLMIYNYSAQIMRAMGNSSTPFVILGIAGVTNVIFDFIFVYFVGLDVAGVAWATVISQLVSAILSLLALVYSKNLYLNLKVKQLRIDSQALKEVIKIGLPAGLQGFFFALPNVFIQAKLYTVDPGNVDLENGAIASGQIESYLYAGVSAIFSACLSFIAENYGANNKKNIMKIFWYSHLINLIYNALAIVVLLIFHRGLLHLFVSSDTAVDAGVERLYIIGFTYILDGAMDINGSLLRGIRRSTFPMVVTLLFCTLFRIIFLETAFNLEFFHTITWLYAVFPISWVMCIVANTVGILILLPKAYKEMEIYSLENKAVLQNN